MQLFLIKHI